MKDTFSDGRLFCGRLTGVDYYNGILWHLAEAVIYGLQQVKTESVAGREFHRLFLPHKRVTDRFPARSPKEEFSALLHLMCSRFPPVCETRACHSLSASGVLALSTGVNHAKNTLTWCTHERRWGIERKAMFDCTFACVQPNGVGSRGLRMFYVWTFLCSIWIFKLIWHLLMSWSHWLIPVLI